MSKVSCPYCNSIQVKAMSNQPKKYPRPIDPIDLADWQKGYDCKKCGNDFIVQPSQPREIKKTGGFFGKLIKWIVILLIAFFALAYFVGESDTSTKSKPVAEKEAPVTETTIKEDPLDQKFSKEAEEAAHAYTPPLEEREQKSIADSQNQSETLSIKTTLRAKDE